MELLNMQILHLFCCCVRFFLLIMLKNLTDINDKLVLKKGFVFLFFKGISILCIVYIYIYLFIIN